MTPSAPDTPSEKRLPFSPFRFFLVWLMFGLQSFGGGSVVLALIRRGAVQEHGWMTEAEFTRDWVLVQVAPGINLIGFTILIGRRVAGATGIALALLGLLLPSATATVLLTALYGRFATMPAVQAALHGILPATVGLGMMTAYQLARPPLQESRAEGGASPGISLAILLCCAGAAALWRHLPVVLLLCIGGAVAALYRWLRHRARSAEEAAG